MPALATIPAHSTPATRPTTKQHLGSIDYLRGAAALLVCMYHFGGGHIAKFTSPTLDAGFSWGYLGVEIFFAISGFIIPYSMYGTGYTLRQFPSFFAKRAARICPAAYASLALTLAQMVAVGLLLHNGLAAQNLSAGRIASSFLFIAPFTGYPWLNEVFWTLCIEFQFYVVIGLLFNVLFTNVSVPRFLAIGTGLSLLYKVPFLEYAEYFDFSSVFFMGSATLLYCKGQINRLTFWGLLAWFFAVTCMIWPPIIAVAGAATCLVIAFVRAQHPVAKLLGNISFSLYLTHLVVGSTLDYLLGKVYHPTTELGNAAAILFCFVVAVGAAWVFYEAVEQPLTRFVKKHLLSRLPQ